jgi:hypothetical protein
MISDELARQLHDNSTRGKLLSVEEHSLLEQWYAVQDQGETQILAKSNDKTRLLRLQTQVDTALTQLMGITKQIQEVMAENKTLKREIIQLHNQLVQQMTLSLAK